MATIPVVSNCRGRRGGRGRGEERRGEERREEERRREEGEERRGKERRGGGERKRHQNGTLWLQYCCPDITGSLYIKPILCSSIGHSYLPTQLGINMYVLFSLIKTNFGLHEQNSSLYTITYGSVSAIVCIQ